MTTSEIRAAYAELRDRALGLTPSQLDAVKQAAYINGLWAAWDADLATLPDDAMANRTYIDFLTTTIRDPRLDDDAVIQWLDAYPDAIWDRRPGGLFDAVPA